MGIKDLNGFLKEHAPEGISQKHFSELSGKTVAVDTSIYFYKFLYKNERRCDFCVFKVYFEMINKIFNLNP